MFRTFTSMLHFLTWIASGLAILLFAGCGSATASLGAAQSATDVTVTGPAFILFYTDN